ncbi:hypothetical protein IWW34DRAFT_105898 [Fusarium oxysporum f. sp. albedinis]|nr:hypothetical protein IWW34DRAFT_105898 [Fusarium oxysporum f. sp. albedinis]
MKYYVIEIHPSDCITPSPPPVRVSAYNNRYGITGKTNNTSKDAKTFKNQVENL